WFAVLKAGGIAVTTMPQLRAQELAAMVIKARIRHAFCAAELSTELDQARQAAPGLERVILYDDPFGPEVPPLLAGYSNEFENVATSRGVDCLQFRNNRRAQGNRPLPSRYSGRL